MLARANAFAAEGAGAAAVERVQVTVQDWSSGPASPVREEAETGGVDITEADVLVAFGRGIGGPDNIPVVEQLAKALGGEVAATRAVVDAGWCAYSMQVGQTGKNVSPKLYVACGISGAIQHKVGMANSGLIVAINKDVNAPIFEFADLGVVGDALTVMPRADGGAEVALGGVAVPATTARPVPGTIDSADPLSVTWRRAIAYLVPYRQLLLEGARHRVAAAPGTEFRCAIGPTRCSRHAPRSELDCGHGRTPDPGGRQRDRGRSRAAGRAARAGGGARYDVLVVAPALNSRLRYLFADVDRAREQAEQRLRESIASRCRLGHPRAGRSATRTRCGRWRTRCSSFTPTRS